MICKHDLCSLDKYSVDVHKVAGVQGCGIVQEIIRGNAILLYVSMVSATWGILSRRTWDCWRSGLGCYEARLLCQ